MKYLIDLGFDGNIVKLFNENVPATALDILEEKKQLVTTNINYLVELGVTNYVDIFLKFYNMFLIDHSAFDEIFSKYDREDLVAKLEKNIAIMEYL